MNFRFSEIKCLLYRLLLCFGFYQAFRLVFFIANHHLITNVDFAQYLKISYYGFAFDTTAILYTNALFIVLSLLPIGNATGEGYQRLLKIIYFICNGIGMVFNFIDFAYYPFSQTRLTYNVIEIVKNETGAGLLLALFKTAFVFILLFILFFWLWQKLYNKYLPEKVKTTYSIGYFGYSILLIIIASVLCVGGIRGDFKHSTRPINLLDASRHVSTNAQADLVLNSTFSFCRTLGKNTYQKQHFMDSATCTSILQPIKQFPSVLPTKKNVVIFILESFSKEYCGFLNTHSTIKNYQGYTPFLDSLSKESLYFTNAYANGRQSIHGMSSVLAGIPSFADAFTSSTYVHQPISSVVSIANNMGYRTAFFHGAYNGSMGFLGFGNILGMQQYFGKDNFKNDADYDGIWGIWDEPFMQYMAHTVDTFSKPFVATLFSLSSHHPFNVPKAYEHLPTGNKPIDKCIRYSDHALQQFFVTASKMPWYKNTVFVFTADHCNEPYFDDYKTDINRFAVPIIIFDPSKTIPTGADTSLAQQIDIYPTVAQILGYNKPFRSWGSSLLQKNRVPFVINSNGKDYNFTYQNHYYVFDGKNITGIFAKEDIYKKTNLLQSSFVGKDSAVTYLKAFVQDYMERIIDKRL